VTVTRRQALTAVLAAGAAGVSGAETALAQGSGADQLERLLAFERRLEAAYRAALGRDAIDAELGRSLLAQEREHVRGVGLAMRSLGRGGSAKGAPSAPPETALRARRPFARFALELESATVAAYVGVLATLDAPEWLQPLGSIMAAGAQHEVALRQILGEPLLARKR
jgi:hypothetical protein